MLVSNWAQNYWAVSTLAKKTLYDFKNLFACVVEPFIGSKDLDEVSPMDIQKPVFDPKGNQMNRVIRMVKSVACQSQLPREVVFSASHKIVYEDQIRNILGDSTKCVFLTNSSTSAPENLNHAISMAQFNIIKILFQDDFLLGDDHLEKIENFFIASDLEWVVSASVAFFEESNKFGGRITPRFTSSLVRGINRIGAPSAVMFQAKSFRPFKENLSYLFDFEWYLTMQHYYGNPGVFIDSLTGIGVHQDQATWWARAYLTAEKKVLRELHDKSTTPFTECSCTETTSTAPR